MSIEHRTTRRTQRVAALAFAAFLTLATVPAFADIVVYWNIWGSTFRLGSVTTELAYAQTEDKGFHASTSAKEGESHMAIVCEGGQCGIVDDCKACHLAPKRVSTFTRRVADEHRRTHFARATMPVGSALVPFEGGFVRQEAGRLVLVDRNRAPRYRLPAGARLLKDTRTGQPLFIVYDGRTAPETIGR